MEDDGSRRLELVRTAQQQWIEALTDLGGRNTPSWEDLHAALDAAASQLAQWQELAEAGPGLPWLPPGYQQLTRRYAEAASQLGALRALVPALPEPCDPGSGERPVERMVKALAADQDTPWKLPRLYELALRFDRMGMRPLLDELARREADGDLAAAAFDHAWYASILDEIRVRDPRYAAERGGALDEVADDFRHRDASTGSGPPTGSTTPTPR
jgi:hypothetical protein